MIVTKVTIILFNAVFCFVLNPTPTVPEGNNGCNGGNMYNSFMYIIFNDGVDKELGYPYEGTVSSKVAR